MSLQSNLDKDFRSVLRINNNNNSSVNSSCRMENKTNFNECPNWLAAIKNKQRANNNNNNARNAQKNDNNGTMVFNFKDRKEVPNYIENDGFLYTTKRELPKPNDSGFVLLGNLSLDSWPDTQDVWNMGPPSPCDVEFLNANILINGKSSIRDRTKEVNTNVKFNDNLTSIFEYPSESVYFDEFSHENEITTPPPAAAAAAAAITTTTTNS